MPSIDRERAGAGVRKATSRRAPANSARDVALSRDDIVSAAIDCIDRDGIGGFSMRKLAAELGISGPALYWHFRGREELLDACAAEVLQQIDVEPFRKGERWRDAIRRLLRSVWRVAGCHPWLLEVMATQPLHTEEGDRLLHALLVVLRRAGFPPDVAVTHSRVLLWSTFGFIRSAVATRARTGATGSRMTLGLGAMGPDLAAEVDDCLPSLKVLDIDALYEAALGALIAGLGGPPRSKKS